MRNTIYSSTYIVIVISREWHRAWKIMEDWAEIVKNIYPTANDMVSGCCVFIIIHILNLYFEYVCVV